MSKRRPYPVMAPGVGFRESGAIPARHWRAPDEEQRLVATHCSFCGVQCGMYLRVDAQGRVFGVEPRNHEINKTKLCPKESWPTSRSTIPTACSTPLSERAAAARDVGRSARPHRV